MDEYRIEEIRDIQLLKRLARQAEKYNQPHLCNNRHFKLAYGQIAAGTGLLWRLLEQRNGDGGKLVLK